MGTPGSNNSDHTLKNCLFGAVTLTKNTDIDKYGYSGYGIGFDRTSNFSFPGGGFSQNVLIFGADMRYCSHIDNKKKDILVLRKGPSEGLEHTLTAGKMYSINFTVTKKGFCLSLHYNGVNSYLFVDDIEIYIFKANDSEIVATPLCLGNISKDWSVDNMRKTRINRYVYDLSVDYDAITLIILKIFISIWWRKIMSYKMFRFIKKCFFIGSLFLSSLVSTSPLSCISMNNQARKVRPEIINVKSNDPAFYPFSIKTSKCSGSCNNINDPYAKICVPDSVKDLNIKVLNLRRELVKQGI